MDFEETSAEKEGLTKPLICSRVPSGLPAAAESAVFHIEDCMILGKGFFAGIKFRRGEALLLPAAGCFLPDRPLPSYSMECCIHKIQV